jgi:hypothetical protein
MSLLQKSLMRLSLEMRSINKSLFLIPQLRWFDFAKREFPADVYRCRNLQRDKRGQKRIVRFGGNGDFFAVETVTNGRWL